MSHLTYQLKIFAILLLCLKLDKVDAQTKVCPSSGGCLQEVADVNRASCTAKDITLGAVVACTPQPDGLCDPSSQLTCIEGSPAEFYFNFTIIAKPRRYDVGVFIGTSGQSNAIDNVPDSKCCRFILAGSSGDNLDSDGCGDVLADSTHSEVVQLTVQCLAGMGNLLTFPYCTTWSQSNQYVCNSAIDLVPGTGSKCSCAKVTVTNVVVLTPLQITASALGCFPTTRPVVLPFRIDNPSSSSTSVTVTTSLDPSPVVCCPVNSDCFLSPSSTLFVNTLIPSNQFLKCAVVYSGVSAISSYTVTALVPSQDPVVQTLDVGAATCQELDLIHCTVPTCVANANANGYHCTEIPDNSLCTNCLCTTEECNPTAVNVWPDGCIHRFGNTQVLSTDASCCDGCS
jgi:hypothetical protein